MMVAVVAGRRLCLLLLGLYGGVGRLPIPDYGWSGTNPTQALPANRERHQTPTWTEFAFRRVLAAAQAGAKRSGHELPDSSMAAGRCHTHNRLLGVTSKFPIGQILGPKAG